MNRRTLLRTAGVGGALAAAGCLETDAEGIGPGSDGELPRYSRPTYSEWPPVTSYNGGGVVFVQLQLSSLSAIRRAVSAGRLDETHPLVGVPLYSIDRITAAVESLSSYPFGAALGHAVNAAASVEDSADDPEQIVEPSGESILPEPESTPEPTNETAVTNESDSPVDETNATTAPSEGHSTNETEIADADDATADPITAAELGIELDAIALTDDLLVFEGSFDHPLIVEQFGEGFEQVDTQRGISIYEGHGETAGLAFGVSNSQFVVPAETSPRVADDERVLAHSLSGYISTLNRVVDESEGQWLFETTGAAALSVGVWELPNRLDLLVETAVSGTLSAERGDVFRSAASFISTLSVTRDDTGRVTAAEGRFSGLFPAGPPTADELRAALVATAASQELFRESPRAHVTAAFTDL